MEVIWWHVERLCVMHIDGSVIPISLSKEKLHEREKYILDLEMKLNDKDRELNELKLDHETVWANQGILIEQTKELATVRRERDNSEAERAQHLQKIHDIQELLREKENQILALEEQHRIAQENIIYKDEQLRDAHNWMTRVQEMDVLQSQILTVEFRERTEQFNQYWAAFQQQYVEMQQGFLHTVQRLQLELTELRERTGAKKDDPQAAQEGSAESSFVQSKGNFMAANGSVLADGNHSVTNNGTLNGSIEGNNAPAVPVVPSSLLGIGGFVPSGQMAGMHSYLLHPQGIPQSLALPNSGVPQFGSFQPTSQPNVHWPNHQEAQNASQAADATSFQPSQSDQGVVQPGASISTELSSKQSQVTHPEYLTAHGEQHQRSTSGLTESSHQPRDMESNITEQLVYNEQQQAQDSSSSASCTGKFESPEETAELMVEEVASSKQPAEQVPGQQNQVSNFAGPTIESHLKNTAAEFKSNIVNEADTPAGAALLDERSLLACIVRAVPAVPDDRIRISSTLPNRLGKMLAPLRWHDYKKQYGKLDDFVASHPELFVIDGDFIHLREGAQQIISATTAAAKIAAAAAAAAATSTPHSQITRQKRGPAIDSRSSSSISSGNGIPKGSDQHQTMPNKVKGIHENGFSDEARSGQLPRHTSAANGGRHERAGVSNIRHGFGGKQQGRPTGTEYNSRR